MTQKRLDRVQPRHFFYSRESAMGEVCTRNEYHPHERYRNKCHYYYYLLRRRRRRIWNYINHPSWWWTTTTTTTLYHHHHHHHHYCCRMSTNGWNPHHHHHHHHHPSHLLAARTRPSFKRWRIKYKFNYRMNVNVYSRRRILTVKVVGYFRMVGYPSRIRSLTFA